MERKFKTKIKATDESQISDQTIGEVIRAKIEYVIEQTLKTPPHITWLSKYALVWGGKIFNDLAQDNPLRIGFISSYDSTLRRYKPSHLPGRMPTFSEQDKMEKWYGLAFPWPPRGLFDIIQNTMRILEDKMIEESAQIVMAPCRGYINKEGLLVDPTWNRTEEWSANQVSGYLIFRTDEIGSPIVKDYLLNKANPIMQRQVERTKQTAPKLRLARISAAHTMELKADIRYQRIKPLEGLLTNEKIEDWNKLLAIETSNEEADQE